MGKTQDTITYHAVSQADNSINPKEINEMVSTVIMANDKDPAIGISDQLQAIVATISVTK